MIKNFFRKHRRSVVLVSAVLLLSGGITAYLTAFSAEPESPQEKKPARLVETIPVDYAPYTISVRGQGFIRPSRSLVIAGRAGGRVVESYGDLKSGTPVDEGTLLVRLDDEVLCNSLALSRVTLIRSTAQLVSALKSEGGVLYDKWNAYLRRLNTGTTPALPSLESEREKLMTGTFGVLEAYYKVREEEDALEDYRLYAPFTGHLEGDGVELLSIVGAGEALATLTDTRHLEISIPLTREELMQLEDTDSLVSIYAAGRAAGAAGREEAELSGRIVRRNAVMDRNSQTITVHILFENTELNPLFLPGNYATALIRGRTLEEALVLPRALVNGDETVNILEEGRLKKYPVTILLFDGENSVLAPTLPKGRELITTRIQKPFEGMELRTATDTGEADTGGTEE